MIHDVHKYCDAYVLYSQGSLHSNNIVVTVPRFAVKSFPSTVLQLELRKQRKVITSPNSKFVDIEAIYNAQVEAGDRQNVLLDSDSIISITSTLSHITIKE